MKTKDVLKKPKSRFISRWMGEDYPGAEPRFQIQLFIKDILIFVLLPIVPLVLYVVVQAAVTNGKKSTSRKTSPLSGTELSINGKSQIIDFTRKGAPSEYAGILKRSPGTLVKVKLLNVVETYSGAPVHAQIVDASLGRNLMGGTLVGDANSDSNVNRINIEFRYVKDPHNLSRAIPISARALSLDGTLGVLAKKKEGFFARATLNSSGALGQDSQNKNDSQSLNQIIAKALTSGFIQEFASDSQVARNRAQVLSLEPLTEFYVELTDYFPGASK